MNDFQDQVLNSPIPVLVDFYANWCGPCKALVPILEQLSKEADGKYKIVKIDCDSSTDLAKEYNVNVLPTLVLFKDGKEVKRRLGLSNKETIKAFITE